MLPTIVSNTLYLSAFGVYQYLTFLGYAELPFVRRAEVNAMPQSKCHARIEVCLPAQHFVLPIGLLLFVYMVSLIRVVNVTSFFVRIYFP